ncbi:hypothetical protein [Polaribacter aquimarinus]|uniref:Uncharacterized protein n=1 Tax=Polaribacter aquimarinus TaxID=2100726 RepID=A0A2U2JCJ2_9FLAO|nr:hypothetical protein [Polaribacter aquimarinus]PWG06058.1 hypothetical protein DIS07_06400 [Polaribacter aquimarinus]
MKENYNPIVIQYSETDKESKSVKLMSIFLMLIFAFVPLAEIVTDLDYNTISHFSKYTCIVGYDFSFGEVLTFKPIY